MKSLWIVSARITGLNHAGKADSVELQFYVNDPDAKPEDVAAYQAAKLADVCGRKAALVTTAVARVVDGKAESGASSVVVEA